MPVTATPALPQNPRHLSVQVTTGTGSSTLVTLQTGGANGTKITSVIASNGDSTANTVTVGITTAAIFYPLATVTLPANAGTSSAAPPVAMLAAANITLPVDNDGQQYIFLNGTADAIQVKAALVPSSAGSAISFHAFGADF